MQNSFFTKALSGFLSFVLLFGGVNVLHASAQESSESDIVADMITDIPFHENLATGTAGMPYLSYIERHPADVAEEEKVIDVIEDLDEANTTADVEVLKGFEDKGDVLYMPESGKTSWKVNIPKTAKYAIKIEYYPIAEKDGTKVSTLTTIERTLYIDGYVPF